MKNNIYFILLLLFSTILGSNIFAQSSSENIDKYWNYKNRIKYFVNPTSSNTINNRGEGLIMSTRNVGKDMVATYGQQNVWLGFYIAVLATEYKLLMDNGQTGDAANTLIEIDRELDALKRKDYCETFPPWNKSANDWDGFFVREDIFSDESYPVTPYTSSFLSTYNMNFGLTQNDNWQTVPKGNPAYISGIKEMTYNADGSAFTDGNGNTISDEQLKDNDMSQDEAIGLLLGLAFVKKYAPYNEMTKAEQITDKIIMKIRNNDDSGMNWIIRDPDGNIVPNYGTNDPPFFGWPFSAQYAYGFAKAGTYITPNPLSHYLTSAGEIVRRTIWNDIVQVNDIGSSSRWMTMVLGAIGNSWKTSFFFNSTVGTICRKGSYDEWYPFYLFLYAVLQDKSINFMKDKLILCGNDFDSRALTDNNEAPCRGPYCYESDHNGLTEDHSTNNWGSSLRFTHDLHTQSHGEWVNTGVFAGVDYMLLYNLYHIVNAANLPPYTNTANRTVYGTWPTVFPFSPYNNIGTNENPLIVNALSSITSTMVINNNLGNDYDDLGNVTYRAGEVITLKPGFSVTDGATFHGYISPLDICSSGFLPENKQLVGAYDSVMMLTQPTFPAYVPTIQGKLAGSTNCGGGDIIGDTLLLVEDGTPNYIHIDTSLTVSYNIDDSTSVDTLLYINDYYLTNGLAIVTDSSGNFAFEKTDLMDLDSTAHYKFVTKSGFPLEDTLSQTVQEWISDSSVTLTLKNVNQEWQQNFSLSDSTNTLAKVLDLKGNVYVAGYAYNPNTKIDFVTLKYTANGTLLWSRVFNAAANLNDIPKAITVDDAANVYITGSSTDYNGKTNFCTLKYDSAGTLKWSVFYDASGNDDEPGDIAVDNQQRVYVSGSSVLVPALQHDMLTVSYDSNGTQRWVQRYPGTPNLNETANSIAIDSTNTYFFVCGQTWSSAANSQYTTLKYDLNGYLLWSAFYNSPNGITDNAFDVVADAAGNVYVAGSSGTACYSSAGSLKWARTATNQNKVVLLNSDLLAVSGKDGLQLYSTGDSILWNNNTVSVTDMTADVSGNIYVIVDNGVNIRKYDITGDLKWETPFGNVHSVSAKSIGVSANNNVYVSGNIFTAQYTHILTSKYSQCPNQANMLRVQNPNTSVNNQPLKEIKVLVVPNPNNGTMQVVYNLKDPSPAFFEIYDLTGRKVFSQQLNVENKSITISQQQLNGGVYMYSLVQNGVAVALDKMVIIK